MPALNNCSASSVDVIESVDLSGNKLKGLIPEEFDQFVDTSIYLSGNPDM